MEEYARMFADPVRGAAYLSAVRESVRPGMVVADVGAGPGVLGIYAATLGARRVFLVEPDASVNAARALAEENGVADRVEVIRASSTEIELPERADVIVSDLRGVTPFHGRHLQAAADMRRRLLAPGGVCIPRRDRVYAALVEDDTLYARNADKPMRLPRRSLIGVRAYASQPRMIAAANESRYPHQGRTTANRISVFIVNSICGLALRRRFLLRLLRAWRGQRLIVTIDECAIGVGNAVVERQC